jgi:hypothetical protein
MANSKTWYSSTDVALTSFDTAQHTAANILWLLKQLLLGAASGTNGTEGALPSSAYWTVDQSCDASTVNTSGTDLWLSSFDATKLTWSTGAHSWIVLKSPTALGTGGPYYFTLDLNNASTANVTLRLSRGTRPTGGTTSAAPTATGDVSFAAPAFWDNTAPTATGGRLHRCMDANGNFWVLFGKSGAGQMQTAFYVQQLANLRASGDVYDVVCGVDFNASSCLKEGTGFCAGSSNSVMRGWNYAGTSMTMTCPTLALNTSAATALAAGNLTAAHPSDGVWDTMQAFAWITGNTSNNQRKGDVPDVYFTSSAIAQGSRYPSSGTQEKTLFGNTLLPFSVVPSL